MGRGGALMGARWKFNGGAGGGFMEARWKG